MTRTPTPPRRPPSTTDRTCEPSPLSLSNLTVSILDGNLTDFKSSQKCLSTFSANFDELTKKTLVACLLLESFFEKRLEQQMGGEMVCFLQEAKSRRWLTS